MRYKILFFIFYFQSVLLMAQPTFFFATHRAKENGLKYDCQNAKDYILKGIANYKEFQALDSEFRKKYYNELPNTLFLKADKPFIIYKGTSTRKWENCTYTFIDCAQANTLDDVQEIIKKRRTEHKFDNEQILYTHNPAQKVSDKNVIEKNYGELYAKYTIIKSDNAKAVIATFKNNNNDKAVVITVYKNLKTFNELSIQNNADKEEPQIIVLQPGFSTNANLKTENFHIEVFTRTADEKTDNTSWVDWMKDKIRSQVTRDPDYKETIEVRENSITSPTTVTGVRG